MTFDLWSSVLLAEFNALSNADDLSTWRQDVSRQLTKKVQTKIEKLQNPRDCATAKKIICDLNKACGFGCQMHHVLYCFVTSYATERTLVIESAHWRYNPKGYEAYFKPVSETCVKTNPKAITWGGKLNSAPCSLEIMNIFLIFDLYRNGLRERRRH